ncbi:hypothetical protein VF21_03120 [Pseudogymnoascus sp. 05NY08]|nr:hypothetical protein VF21_03120 [Pseudogymnoascus sp. 05NY08]
MYPTRLCRLGALRPSLAKHADNLVTYRPFSTTRTKGNGHTPTRAQKDQKKASANSKIFKVSDEVREAIETGKPVVALETTIYTHGFPYPDNVALATHLESVVRRNGGIPATIGVLNGVARVGLSEEELTELVNPSSKTELMKVSRRDLPFIAGLGLTGRKINGGTTIAGTMLLAELANISVFGTGGLGGVHRGGENTMDVSADLQELGRTNVTVISSGCKSFLDIPRTLEYLETQGVCVATFAGGRKGDIDFPAFWTRESGVRSPMVIENAEEAAAIIHASELFRANGMLFANPIPKEWALEKSQIDQAIEAAVAEAAEKGFHGHRNTPFILSRIKELTEGKSVPANRALVESNVAIATRVAVELANLRNAESNTSALHTPVISADEFRYTKEAALYGVEIESPETTLRAPTPAPVQTSPQVPKPTSPQQKVDILVAGAVAVDVSCNYKPFDKTADSQPLIHTSNPASITETTGGVGFNVATAAQYASKTNSVQLCSLIATDTAGQLALSTMNEFGLRSDGITTLPADANTKTAKYVAVNTTGNDLFVAMADMDIVGGARDTFQLQWQSKIDAAKPKWVVVDANWHPSAFKQWITAASAAGAKVAFEPVSTAKSQVLFPEPSTAGLPLPVFPKHAINLATPNTLELTALHSAARDRSYLERQDWWGVIDALGIPSSGARDRFVHLTSRALVDAGVPQMTVQLLPFIPSIVTKLGSGGCLLTELLTPDSPKLTAPEHAPYVLARSNNGTDFVGGVYMRHFPAEALGVGGVRSVNGAGDTFLGVLVAGLAEGVALDEALVGVAQRASVLTLGDAASVSPLLKTVTRGELEGLAGRSL